MRKLIVYIAVSLDGYIATEDGGIDWLTGFPNPDNNDYGYARFFATVDTTLMGYKTYQDVLRLAENFPYPDTTNYVFSRSPKPEAPYVTFTNGDSIPSLVQQLKAQDGKNIWLIGGGELNAAFLQHDLIDEMIIHTIPVVLGTGRPLFAGNVQKTFKVKDIKLYDTGVVETRYER